MLTDGRDTCECDEGGYTDNYPEPRPTSEMRPAQQRSGESSISGPSVGTGTFTAAQDAGSFNAGLKARSGSPGHRSAPRRQQGQHLHDRHGPQRDDDKGRVNTIAWLASGAGLEPGGPCPR